jgi:hypothetical protein
VCDAAAKEPPSVDALLGAVRRCLLEQRSDYDRILLPVLGMGEQIEIRSQRMNAAGVLYATRPGSAWLFTRVSRDSWLDVPLRSMLSDLRNTWILLERGRVERDVLERLRPPVLPKLRDSLAAFDWWVADFEGLEGGRMNRSEFFDEVGDQPWIRFNHDPRDATAGLERWRGTSLLGGWTVPIMEHFRVRLPWKRPDAPCSPVEWRPRPADMPLETTIQLFLMDDPYELLRFFVMEEHGFDPDRLGPLTVWKDFPDLLEEFSDHHDSQLADLPTSVGLQTSADLELVQDVLEEWLELIARHGCEDFPTLGHIRRVDLPGIQMPRPDPLAAAEPEDDTVIFPKHVYAASALPPDTWIRSVPARTSRVE